MKDDALLMMSRRILTGVLLAVCAANAVAKESSDADDTGARALLRLDANRDGYLSSREAAPWITLSHRFMQLDVNRDGQLSLGELNELAVQKAPVATSRLQAARGCRADAEAIEAGVVTVPCPERAANQRAESVSLRNKAGSTETLLR